jgi:hypothetical protein
MKGNFSRDTSGPARLARYTRVLLPQGGALVDADFNEQSGLYHDFLRTLVVDLMGRGWRPGPGQFTIAGVDDAKEAFKITKGHFYVDGILCDNTGDCTYINQPFLPPHDDRIGEIRGKNFIAYVECWEWHLCAVQRPEFREIALGQDTASRTQVVWQVRAATEEWAKAQQTQVYAALGARIAATALIDVEASNSLKALQDSLSTLTTDFLSLIELPKPISLKDFNITSHQWFDALTSAPPRLRAMAKRDASDNEACSISPGSIYRGRENQLYRVEIHKGGSIVGGDKPTFKWSRENGSVLYAVRTKDGITVSAPKDGKVTLTLGLVTLGRDNRSGICVGNWVELTSDDFELDGLAPPLGQIQQIDRTRQTVGVVVPDTLADFRKCTLLRRWDQTEHLDANGTVPITEAIETDTPWTALERGVQVQFQPGGVYRTGDYWLIPARVASGDVVWPQEKGSSAFIGANGIGRHRAAIGHGTKSPAGWGFTDAGRTISEDV